MVKERKAEQKENDIWVVRFAPLYRNGGIAGATICLILIPFVPPEWSFALLALAGGGVMLVAFWWIFTRF